MAKLLTFPGCKLPKQKKSPTAPPDHWPLGAIAIGMTIDGKIEFLPSDGVSNERLIFMLEYVKSVALLNQFADEPEE